MPAQLRPVARIERDSDSVLFVTQLTVGVRLAYRYLLSPLQMYLYEKPFSEFATTLYGAGHLSRQAEVGHGYVRLYYDRAEVPIFDSEAKGRGEGAKTKIRTFPFRADTTAELVKLCGEAHRTEAEQLIVRLTDSLRAVWFSGSSILEVRQLAADQVMKDPKAGIDVAFMFEDWVKLLLEQTELQTAHSLPL